MPDKRGYIRGFLRGDGMLRSRIGFYQSTRPIIDTIRETLHDEGIGTSFWIAEKPTAKQYSLEVVAASLEDFRDWLGPMFSVESWSEVAGFMDADGRVHVRRRSRTPDVEISWSQCDRNVDHLLSLAEFLRRRSVGHSLRPFRSAGHPQWYLRLHKADSRRVLTALQPDLFLKAPQVEQALLAL